MSLNDGTIGEHIVPLWRKKATLQSRVASDVLVVWKNLRNGEGLPRRADLDPSLLGAGLPYSFVLQRVAPGIARFRVAGRHLHDLMGMDVRAMPVTTFAAVGERARFLPLIDAVFDTPAVLELELVAKKHGHADKHAEMLVLPMLGDDGRVTRALGCLVAHGPVAYAPYRFKIQSARPTAIDLMTPPLGDWGTPRMTPAAPNGLAEPRAAFTGSTFTGSAFSGAAFGPAPTQTRPKLRDTHVKFLKVVD